MEACLIYSFFLFGSFSGGLQSVVFCSFISCCLFPYGVVQLIAFELITLSNRHACDMFFQMQNTEKHLSFMLLLQLIFLMVYPLQILDQKRKGKSGENCHIQRDGRLTWGNQNNVIIWPIVQSSIVALDFYQFIIVLRPARTRFSL